MSGKLTRFVLCAFTKIFLSVIVICELRPRMSGDQQNFAGLISQRAEDASDVVS